MQASGTGNKLSETIAFSSSSAARSWLIFVAVIFVSNDDDDEDDCDADVEDEGDNIGGWHHIQIPASQYNQQTEGSATQKNAFKEGEKCQRDKLKEVTNLCFLPKT